MIVAAVIYVYMQYFPISDVFVIISHICWICVHGKMWKLGLLDLKCLGDTPIVYFILNESLRKGVLRLIFKRKLNKNTTNIAFIKTLNSVHTSGTHLNNSVVPRIHEER